MKHYIYKSETKINEYYQQLQQFKNKQRETSWEFNLGLLKGGLKDTRDAQLSSNEKIEKIVKHIKSSDKYGSIYDDNAPYFSMSIPMKSGRFQQRHPYELAMWGGETQDHVIALFGSMKHVVGYLSNTKTDAASNSILFYNVISNQMDNNDLIERKPGRFNLGAGNSANFLEFIHRAVRYLGVFNDFSVFENLEFFAVKYQYGKPNNSKGKKVVVGSPLYVALK